MRQSTDLTQKISMRVTPGEKETILRKATESGQSLSEYVRDKALSKSSTPSHTNYRRSYQTMMTLVSELTELTKTVHSPAVNRQCEMITKEAFRLCQSLSA